MQVKRLFTGIALCLFVLVSWAAEYDIVINNGRVIGPETGLDAIRNLGILGDQIEIVEPHVTNFRNGLHGTKLAQVVNVAHAIILVGRVDERQLNIDASRRELTQQTVTIAGAANWLKLHATS